MNDVNYITIIGQILGIVAVGMGFAIFQMKTAKKILVMQTLTCVVLCAHYILIGAISAFALNAVAIVRNIVYYNRDKKLFSSNLYPVFFALVMVILGILSWESIFSVLVILGLSINTLCMSFKNSQNIRKSVLVTSPMVLIYDVTVFSIGGIIFESIAIISAVIGLLKNKKSKGE